MESKSKTVAASATSKLFVTLAAVLLGTMWMCRYSVGAITDVLEKELNTTSSGVGMLSSLYYITYVAMQIPIGLVLELYASEFVLAVAGLLLAVGTLLFASTSSLGVAMFGRLLMGLGSAPIWIGSISVVGHRFGNKRVSTVVGKLMFAGQIAIMVSSTAQAAIYSRFQNWRAVFYFFAAMALLSSLALSALFVYEQLQHNAAGAKDTCENMEKTVKIEMTKDPPTVGETVSNGSVDESQSSPPLSSSRSPSHSPRRSLPQVPAQKGPVQLMRSVSIMRKSLQKRSERSLTEATPWEKLKQTLKDTVGNGQNYVIGVFYFGIMTTHFALGGLWLPPFLRVKYAYSRSTAALLSALTFLSTGFGAIAFSRSSNRLKLRRPILICAALVCVMFEFVIYAPASTHVVLVATALLVAGLSIGALPVVFASVRELNWYKDCTESSVAFVNSMGMLSGFVAQAAAGWLLDLHWKSRSDARTDDGLRVYTTEDYASAFYVVVAGIVLCVVFGLGMRETHCKNVSP